MLDEPKLADLYEFIIKVVDERVSEIKVTREDFDRLQKAIAELNEAQRRTEASIDKLAKAQLKTEARISKLEEAVTRLAEAQSRTEVRVDKLEEAVTRLAEAQRRTEARIDKLEEAVIRLEEAVTRLAEAQRRTEARVDKLEKAIAELAEAQRRTEEALGELVRVVREQNVKIEMLSDIVGFGLEDIARVVLPGWLYRHLGVEMGEFRREFLSIDDRRLEVNLYGEGVMRGERVVIVGECKSRIYKRDIERFYKRVYRPVTENMDVRVLGVMFGYLIYPEARKKADELGLYVVASYER